MHWLGGELSKVVHNSIISYRQGFGGKEPSQLTANKLTVNQWFCYSDLVTDFVALILSLSEGSGKMARVHVSWPQTNWPQTTLIG